MALKNDIVGGITDGQNLTRQNEETIRAESQAWDEKDLSIDIVYLIARSQTQPGMLW